METVILFSQVSIYGLFCYFVGYYFQNNKIKKISNILLDHAIFIAGIIFLLAIFVIKDINLKQAAFTFSSVYFGFWLGNEQRKKDDVRVLKYYLGLILEEQRYNLHQFKVIMGNFSFLFDDLNKITLNAAKMSTIYSLVGLLKVESHSAYITSGAITTLTSAKLPTKEKDDILNLIEISYTNIEHLKSFIHTVTIDFKNKSAVADMILNSPYAEGANNDMKAKVQMAAKELMIARRSAVKTVNKLSKFLNKLGILHDTSEIRAKTLTERDNKFIKEVIRTKNLKPEDVYRTPE